MDTSAIWQNPSRPSVSKRSKKRASKTFALPGWERLNRESATHTGFKVRRSFWNWSMIRWESTGRKRITFILSGAAWDVTSGSTPPRNNRCVSDFAVHLQGASGRTLHLFHLLFFDFRRHGGVSVFFNGSV